MKNRKKLKTVRVSVTLPQIMVEDFKAKSEVTGVSISRLIFLRLRTKQTVLIVPDIIRKELKKTQQMLKKIIMTGQIDSQIIELFQEQVDFNAGILEATRGGDVYVP